MAIPVLAIEGLSVSFRNPRGWVEVLREVSLDIEPGEIVGVVGESGSGKSVTSLAAMRLLGPQGRIDAGAVRLEGRDLVPLPGEAMRRIRGRDMAMIFQEPGTSLNPVRRVGDQIAEAMTEHGVADGREAERRAIALMERVGIPAAARRARDYPHQMSGGMKQRIMIAMALACRPKLLIADEPTTALDVTIQAQILNLILDLRESFGMAVLLITHDMGVVATMADRVAVMYAGQVVERAPSDRLFGAPRHPYAQLLLRAIPSARVRQRSLPVIGGATPPPGRYPSGCRFEPRCPLAVAACREAIPALAAVAPDHWSRCIRPDAVAGLAEAGGAA
jgi:oligopeptide/dipeptide ABC transporter ATP-binding protein